MIRNGHRSLARSSAWLILGLLGPGLSAYAEEAPRTSWSATVHVRFDRSEDGLPVARVSVDLRPDSPEARDTRDVQIAMARDGFPGGYGSHVWGIHVVAKEGGPPGEDPAAIEPVSIPEGRYRLRRPSGGTFRYQYGVLLDHDAGDWGPGPDEAPYALATLTFWTGRSLFILPSHTKGEITFETLPGERTSTSLEPAGDRPGVFAFPDEESLRETFLVAGAHGVSEFAVGRTTIILAMGDALRGWLPQVKDSASRFVTAAAEVFGSSPARRVLIVGNHLPGSGGFNGGVYGRDVSFLVGNPDQMADAGAWEPFVTHELFHLWNGTAMSFAGQQYWFTEGFTDYYARLLLLRLGRSTSSAFLADLAARTQRYLEAANGASLLDAGDAKFDNHALVYDGGFLAALCLDVAIRKASGGRGSMDSVMRALYARSLAKERSPMGIQEIEAEVATAAGQPLKEFFARHIRGTEPLPIADSLTELGVTLKSESDALPTTDWCVWTALRCPSVTSGPEGLSILRSDNPSIRTGDIVRGADSTALRSFDDLRVALKGKRPGDSIHVVVYRPSEKRNLSLDLTLGGDREASIPTSPVVRVTVSESTDPNTAARGLRESIFRK